MFYVCITKQANNMNLIKKLIGTALIALILTGCVNDAKQSFQNGNFIVEFLFEQNGCKMYRFKDGGRYVYWSDCQGKVQGDYSTQSGKTRVTHNEESITSE
jgi:hypothetical protein